MIREYDRWLPVHLDPAFRRYTEGWWSRMICPYCGDAVPNAAEPETWACCGEVGHAVDKDDDAAIEAAKLARDE